MVYLLLQINILEDLKYRFLIYKLIYILRRSGNYLLLQIYTLEDLKYRFLIYKLIYILNV